MPNPLEEIGAKGVGAAKATLARIKGISGVFKTLVEQHGEVSTMLMRLKASQNPEKRLDLWSKIRVELLSHERGELSVVYPALRDFEQTRQFAEEHDGQASELETTIAELDAIDTASDMFASKLDELIALVQQHVDTEENEYFPTAVDVVGKDLAQELDGRFLAKKEQVLEELPAVH